MLKYFHKNPNRHAEIQNQDDLLVTMFLRSLNTKASSSQEKTMWIAFKKKMLIEFIPCPDHQYIPYSKVDILIFHSLHIKSYEGTSQLSSPLSISRHHGEYQIHNFFSRIEFPKEDFS